MRRLVVPPALRMMTAVVPLFYMAYMAFVYATSRVRTNNFLDLHDIIKEHDGAVGLLWHEEVFTVAFGYRRLGFKPHTLASRGDAGAIITRILELCGFVVFRGGSSSKQSRRDLTVLASMVKHMRETRQVIYGITVDGSQGPAYRLKPGGVIIAQRCKRPIVLARTWYKRSIRLNTWDRTAIPLPFNEIGYWMRGPYFVPDEANTPTGLDHFLRRIESELVDLARESYHAFGQPLPENLRKAMQEMSAHPGVIPNREPIQD